MKGSIVNSGNRREWCVVRPVPIAPRILGRRYRLAPDRAALIAELAGLGPRDEK